MSKALALICALLLVATALQPVSAVICESFTTQEKCEQIMTSSGGCKWTEEEKCVHDPTKILPAGMVGIASVGEAVPVFLGSQPAPEVRQRSGRCRRDGFWVLFLADLTNTRRSIPLSVQK
jgi:hypothetical protein